MPSLFPLRSLTRVVAYRSCVAITSVTFISDTCRCALGASLKLLTLCIREAMCDDSQCSVLLDATLHARLVHGERAILLLIHSSQPRSDKESSVTSVSFATLLDSSPLLDLENGRYGTGPSKTLLNRAKTSITTRKGLSSAFDLGNISRSRVTYANLLEAEAMHEMGYRKEKQERSSRGVKHIKLSVRRRHPKSGARKLSRVWSMPTGYRCSSASR